MEKILPIYECILWNNCKNNCKFCHQKANYGKYPEKFLSNEEKITSIRRVKSLILRQDAARKLHIFRFHILLMGGELFDSKLLPEVEKEFFSLAQLIANQMAVSAIGLLYLNTNLIYKDVSLLMDFLSFFFDRGLIDNIRFTTSFDMYHRYNSPKDLAIVKQNLKKLSRITTLHKVANTVLTDDTVNLLLKNPSFIRKFQEMYDFKLNPIPYIKLDGIAAPTRSKLHSLLLKLNSVYPGYIKEYARNISIPQKRILWEYYKGFLVSATAEIAPCGHSVNFRNVYADSDQCFVCDCINLANSIG